MSGTHESVALPTLMHLGDAEHGVDRYARDVAQAVARLAPVETLDARSGDVPAAPREHLHFTDRLWGADPAAAAARIERRAHGTRLTVTLHDVPQPSDGTGLARRVDCYRRVVRAAAGVVCNSEHERSLLADAIGEPVDAVVIPLPAATPQPRPHGWASDGAVAVLGFFYPGKGHREVVDAVAGLRGGDVHGADPSVAALGRAAPGHEAELDELQAHAAALGVRFASTGFLDDDELLRRSRAAAVPVVAHRHVSASGSLTAWTAAGRRPITVANAYFREMAALRPGTLTLVDDADLGAAIAAALRDPDSTWIDADTSVHPDLDDVARAYVDWWTAR